MEDKTRLQSMIENSTVDKLDKISKELLGHVNRTGALKILINQYRLENKNGDRVDR